MYVVVGCSECQALWIVEGRPKTTQCPRCSTRRKFDLLRKFTETDDVVEARQVRASMLAERQNLGEAFDGLDSYTEMDDRVHKAAIDDEAYLESKGIDVDQVNDAGDRAGEGSTTTRSRRETVLDALDQLEKPSEQSVITYASERGVPESYVRRALQSLVSSGQATEENGTYRLL
ncbi:MAG: DUF5817 domain-containing protein [archaeon]